MTAPQLRVGTLLIECEPQDEPTAQVIAGACDEALRLVKACCGFDPPSRCRIYVMTSWRGFIFHSAPWAWKIALALNYPLWSGRMRRAWPLSAGLTQYFGRRTAIGIKPPRLLEISDKSVGRLMFVEEKDPIAKIRHVVCHELTHAASAHLRLPAWLNEGLAAVTVDRMMGRVTIREDTLGLVQRTQPKAAPPSYRTLMQYRGEALAYHAVRGYWVVRFLEERQPGLVRDLLATRQTHRSIEIRIAERLGLTRVDLWQEIDGIVISHFCPGDTTAI